ncbi:Polyadenylate-binding protein-interacting protein 12 [Zea mays]|uniref:Polyadenylate-binding protein-interacting protein 12 n=1 Tax=Zea mays TaxID=4577 RepID=A0A3L6FUU0_MAIZE|nr:Polyadenylate-binding protein-interacting protein 12 [Zea mays]
MKGFQALAKRKRTAGAAVVEVVAKWKVGDLVLTKMKGFQAWPAMFDDHEVIVILLCSKIMVGCNGQFDDLGLMLPALAEFSSAVVGCLTVYYYSYQIFQNRAEARALERSRRGLSDGSVGVFQSLTVAALSGCVNALLTNPIWVVVTGMQTHKKANKQQILQGLTCALDEPLEAATAENAPYKTDNEERVSDHCEERGGRPLDGLKVDLAVHLAYGHQVTEENLAALFINYGQVVDCHMCGDPNSVLQFAFIEFTDEEGARVALNLSGTVLRYYPVRVLPSKTAIAPVNPTFVPRSDDEREMCARTIYCTNIDKKVTQADLKLFFESICGEKMTIQPAQYHWLTAMTATGEFAAFLTGANLIMEHVFSNAAVVRSFTAYLGKAVGVDAPSKWRIPVPGLPQGFNQVGIIMYLPTSDARQRKEITEEFFSYRSLARSLWDDYSTYEHWAKIEVPKDKAELAELQARLRKRFPVDAYNKARMELDPNKVLSNAKLEKMFPVLEPAHQTK